MQVLYPRTLQAAIFLDTDVVVALLSVMADLDGGFVVITATELGGSIIDNQNIRCIALLLRQTPTDLSTT
jgi:hypothetical protein